MRRKNILSVLLVAVFSFSLASCDMLDDLFGNSNNNNNSDEYDDELESSSGKWTLLDDESTHFTFDGSKDVMTYNYVENGNSKYSGTYRVIHRGVGKDVLTPLTFIFTRSDKEKEDWISCYVEDFDTNFTQFTIMEEEEDLGMIDGFIHTYHYRISELPYKMGTYILEGNELKEESDNYSCADEIHIPNGTYTLETGESFTFLMTKPRDSELFQYRNGDVVVEGTLTVAYDQKTIYLYLEHDPYEKVTNEDKDRYDTTFSTYYPPDIYLRGDFSNSEYIIINDLYHHGESPTEIKDSIWTFGTYNKVIN